MSVITESIADLSAALPGSGKLSEQRSAALAAFRQHGLPDTSNEDWRYTDISSLDQARLAFRAPAQSAEARIDLLPVDGDRIVFVNGQLDATLTQIEAPKAAGISVLAADWSALHDGFPQNDDILAHPLGQLNTATAQHGVLIRTPVGHDNTRTINIVLVNSAQSALALQPRIVLDLAERSSARVVLHFASDAQVEG
jgi:Fe-S cluster assembly protein SufD